MTLESIINDLLKKFIASPELAVTIGTILFALIRYIFPILKAKMMTMQAGVLRELAIISIRYTEQTMEGKTNVEKRTEAVATLQQLLRDKGLGKLADNIPSLVSVIESLLQQNVEHPATPPQTEAIPLPEIVSTPALPLSMLDVMTLTDSQADDLASKLVARGQTTLSTLQFRPDLEAEARAILGT